LRKAAKDTCGAPIRFLDSESGNDDSKHAQNPQNRQSRFHGITRLFQDIESIPAILPSPLSLALPISNALPHRPTLAGAHFYPKWLARKQKKTGTQLPAGVQPHFVGE
jgi:hypothetical protein